MMTNKILFRLCLVFAAVFFSGCFEAKHHYFLNPDGSGKVQFEVTYNKDDYSHIEVIEAAAILEKLKDNALGITYWQDIFAGDKGEGQAVISGTAFFDNINEVSLPVDGFSLHPYKVYFQVEEGQGELELRDPRMETLENLNLSEEREQKLIDESQAKYMSIEPLVAATVGKAKVTVLFSLPGDISEVVNMIRKEKNQVFIRFDGSNFTQSSQAVLQDEAWWKRHAKAGIDIFAEGPLGDEDLNQVIFGEKSGVRARVEKLSGPIVDCQKEVMGKNVHWAPYESTGLLDSAEESEAVPLQDIRVIQQSATYDFNLPPDVFPARDKYGYSLMLVATVPESVIIVSEGKIIEAMTDQEQSLMLMDNAQMMVEDIFLSDEGFYLRFKVNLLEPNAWSSKIQKISGYLSGFSGQDIAEIDLNIPGFEPGLKSEKIRARIESLKKDPEDMSYEILTMRINLPREAILDLRFFDDQDREMNIQTDAVFCHKEEVLVTCRLKGRYPLRGRIVLETYKDIKKITLPFSLSGIDMLGRPVQK